MAYTPTIPAVANTASIRDAEFIKLTVTFTNGSARTTRVFTFSSSYQTEDFGDYLCNELGALMSVGGSQRSITSTGYDTTVNITGLDSSWIYIVAGGPAAAPIPVTTKYSNGTSQPDIPIGYYPIIKGSSIQIYRGFYNTNWQLMAGGLVLRYTGIITNYSINENRDTGLEALDDTYTISLNSSSIRKVLENRVVGRKTNPKSWTTADIGPFATDTAMDRVPGLEGKQFDFGKDPVTGSSSSSSTTNNGGGSNTQEDYGQYGGL